TATSVRDPVDDRIGLRCGTRRRPAYQHQRIVASRSASCSRLAPKREILMASNRTAPTQFLQVGEQRYAYRRFGGGSALPLLCLQHFTGTLDNWDPAITDPLAESGREVILFDNAGVGRSTGSVPATIGAMAQHALVFLDGLRLSRCDVLGFSLGGM